MKKSFGTLVISIILAGTVLTSCSSPADKVEDAQDNVEAAEKELAESEAYAKDVADYRSLTEMQIAENEKNILAFNARIDSQKAEAKSEYKAKIAELDAKNSDMKKKLADFNSDNKSVWETFKKEFNADMEALAKAFVDFSTNDKK